MPRVRNTISTELDAINTMLSVIGERPVNSLTGALPADVGVAKSILHETARKIQLMGWHFNSEEGYPLKRGNEGFITLPSGVFRVTLVEPDSKDIVQRGTRLYDRANHTFVFDEDINATIYLLLAFEEMPEAFRWFVTVSAGRKFQDRVVGSSEQHSFTERDEQEARVIAEREDAEVARASLAKGRSTTFTAGWGVAKVMER